MATAFFLSLSSPSSPRNDGVHHPEKKYIKKRCTTVCVCFPFAFRHTFYEISGKRPSLLLITAIISSLLFTPRKTSSLWTFYAAFVGAHLLPSFLHCRQTDEGEFSMQYFNLSQKIVVLRYLHCCFLRENSLIRYFFSFLLLPTLLAKKLRENF